MGDWGYPIISADSHITEAPGTYVDHIDPAYRDVAPKLVDGGEGVGDIFVVDGMKRPIPMGLVAAAGKPPEEIRVMGVRFEQLHRSGWDPTARLADQDRDGVSAEVIYPTVGMSLCNHRDFDYKRACFQAYNRWIAEYCSTAPDRLLGCGQTAMRTPEEGIADLREIKALGLRGVMMPGVPAHEDYDHTDYDAFWDAAVELGLPLSFHILTTRGEQTRGPAMSTFLSTVRGCQDIMAMLVLGGVFERHPDLQVVCVEADAGWVPHFMYRMDHAYKRHRFWLPPGQQLSKLPSEYFAESIYVTFQDDWTAFRFADAMNWRRLLWANDFPHSDSTWPWSQGLLDEHTAQLTDEQREAILCTNVADLYGVDLSTLPIGEAA
jgi:predicted TIM-barrel fold metal-dependent hydrolase